MSHVRITSDGTPSGTKVTIDGVEVTGVKRVVWGCDASLPRALVYLTLYGHAVDIDVEGDEIADAEVVA